MVKELIRNGGFERGNLDFWRCVHGNTEIVTDVKKRGTYAAKITAGSFSLVELQHRDHVEIVPYAIYKHTGWYRSVSFNTMKALVSFYDSSKVHIQDGDVAIWQKTGSFDWTLVEAWFVVPEEASYLIFDIAGIGSNGTYGYVDSLSLQEVDLNRLAVYTKELLKKTNYTSTGTFYSDEYFTGIWKYGEFYLNVTSLTGTDPTLDITIQAYDPSTCLWKDIVVFDQATGAGSQLKVATAGLGWNIRVKYVTGGTITDCDFVVGVVFKR